VASGRGFEPGSLICGGNYPLFLAAILSGVAIIFLPFSLAGDLPINLRFLLSATLAASLAGLILGRSRQQSVRVVKASGDRAYLVEDGMKRYIPDPITHDFIMLDTYRQTERISDFELRLLPEGAPLPSILQCRLVKGDGPAQYIIWEGRRKHVPDEPTAQYFFRGRNYEHVSEDELDQYPRTGRLRSILAVAQDNTDGQLRELSNQTEALKSLVILLSKQMDQIGSRPKQFVEDLSGRVTDNWEYAGSWQVIQDGQNRYLAVTNSDDGGIAKACRLWDDYEFEFETKIVQSNSGWIVRARDLQNYVLLQCGRDQLIPYFRVNGEFLKMNAVRLPALLPLQEWYGVRIKVSGSQLMVAITVDGKTYVLLDEPLLATQVVSGRRAGNNEGQDFTLALSNTFGSIGFREWETENACFRNIKVTRI